MAAQAHHQSAHPRLQTVLRNDITQLPPAAYTVYAPVYRQTGIYAGVTTVEAHQELVDEFVDESLFPAEDDEKSAE